MDFDTQRILRILPQRPPFLLIDRVTRIEPRRAATAIKCVTANEPVLAGHFPDNPVLPGVLVLEGLAQLTSVLAFASEPWDPEHRVLKYLGIDKAKFRRAVRPGDRLTLEIEVTHHRANIWQTSGVASVGETVVTTGDILVAIADRNE